ncbi:MAG: tRNA lysidine(34) synthetase TilS, partial [Verrucomicrobiota bacterium]
TRRIEVRLWREGDRYRPLGSPGERKLQDCFVDRKIPRNERAIRPILCAQGEPIWCPGLLPAASARIEAESIDALEITYLRT